MAAPDWFDPRLRVPTPRRLVASSLLRLLRLVTAVGIGLSPLAFVADRHGPFFIVGILAMIAAFALVFVEYSARGRRPPMRSGVASIARIVPHDLTLGDVARDVAGLLARSGATFDTIEYEYGTAEGVQRGIKSVNTGWGPRSAVFPEGRRVGARFVVLFDPRNPSRHWHYNPKDLFRIAPPAE